MTRAERIEETLADDDPVQVGFTGSVAQMRALHEAIRNLPEAGRVTPMLTEYAPRDFSLLDIIAEGCSKGSALADWARRLALEPAEVMAGDNLNDLEMLEFAGRPVVMGNAVAELKGRGWPVAASHDAGSRTSSRQRPPAVALSMGGGNGDDGQGAQGTRRRQHRERQGQDDRGPRRAVPLGPRDAGAASSSSSTPDPGSGRARAAELDIPWSRRRLHVALEGHGPDAAAREQWDHCRSWRTSTT